MAHRSGEVTNAVVLEIGRQTTKLGYAGEDAPRAWCSSFVAVDGTMATNTDTGYEPSKKSNSPNYTFNPMNQNSIMHGSNITDSMQLECAISASSGLVEDWDLWLATLQFAGKSSGMNSCMHNSSNDSYNTSLFEDAPLVLVEKSHNTAQHRANMLDLVFECTDAPAAFLAKDAVLDCFACGRTTGIVADMGDTTLVTPVYEGWAETKGMLRGVGVHAIQSKMLAVMDDLYRVELLKSKSSAAASNANANTKQHNDDLLVEAMPYYQIKSKNNIAARTSSLIRHPQPFHSLARREMALRCLEHFSPYSIAEYGYKANNFKHIPKLSYTLPDGTEIQLGNERFEIGELLYGDDGSKFREKCMNEFGQEQQEEGEEPQPSASKINSNNDANSKTTPIELFTGAIQNMICESAFRCDREQQAQLLGNVVVAGGGACFENVVDRVRAEVEAIIHTHTPGWRVKVLSPPLTERAYCSWLGGSILGSLGSFGEIYITKAEYEECGSSIVYRKCP